MEDIFNNSPYVLTGWSLKKRIHFAAFLMLSLSLSEHLFSWYSYLNDRLVQVYECDWKIVSWFNFLTYNHLTHVYKVFPNNFWSVLWAEYMNVSMTFQWNFVDLFIMILSLSIATKFKMLNERLSYFKGRVCSTICFSSLKLIFWNLI